MKADPATAAGEFPAAAQAGQGDVPAIAPAAALSFQAIVKRFGATAAVDGVSLDVAAGEFCALIGPSGCGKTTLLRIAAGFVRQDEGSVALLGHPADRLPPNRRGLGFVFQSYALFPTKTVAQNIGFALALQRRPRAAIRARVDELCSLMALDGMAGRYPHELSGGQQQRVALARALASEPQILLLDEPLSALDAKIRVQLRSEIRRVVAELGVTALYITHDQEEALAIADRVAVMHGGRLLQSGPPMEVYLRPADPFVASFVGTTNLLDCRVADANSISIAGRRSAARIVAVNGHAATGVSAHLALRPEHVELLDDPDAPGALPATLSAVTFLGPIVRLTLVIGGTMPLLADVPAIAWLEQRREPGAVLAWRPRPGLGIAFETGQDA